MIPIAVRRLLMCLLLCGLAAPLLAVPGSWRVLGPDGGSVYDLAFAPSRPQTLYAAVAGGVFRSLDGGASWGLAGAGLSEEAPVTGLAVDPARPLTVYAAQSGIYKSLDGGTTWKKTAASFATFKVVVPSRGSGTVYAVSAVGLFKSTDGGGAWKPLTRGLPPLYRALELVVDPADPSRLYTLLTVDNRADGVYKSGDGGFSWKRSNQGIPAGSMIFDLAIDPGSPKSLYAAANSGRVYRSRDGGALWRSTGRPLEDPVNSLWVDRAGGVFAATGRGMLRSEDGGGTWTDAAQGLPEGSSVRALIFPSAAPRSLLAGVFTSGAQRGGVFASADSGASWTVRSTDLSALSVSSVALAPDALWAVGNEVLFKSTDRGETWRRIRFDPVGLATLVAVAPAAPEDVYVVLYDGTLWRSRDGGESWEPAGDPGLRPLRLVFDPRSSSTLYAAGNGGMARSTDGGTTWTPLSAGLIYDLAVSPSSPSTLYAPTRVDNQSRLLRSPDGGATFTAKSLPFTLSTAGSLAVDPRAPETLYSASSDRVYWTGDGGALWLPFGDVLRFRGKILGPLLFAGDPARLHMAVWLDDVYRLADPGDADSWEPLGSSPGHLRFNVLAADPEDPCRLYAGTETRGLLAFTESGTAACP
jgi:photosystem II stability/assembly factor-like uncharacterized protein